MIVVIKLLVCIAFLLYACRSDLKTRTVPNELWGVAFVVALPLVVADTLTQGSRYILHTIVSVIATYISVYILFRIGAFGGADAKSLIALSVIFPIFPGTMVAGYGIPICGTYFFDVFAFSTLANAILLTTVVPLGILVYNLCILSLREIMERPRYMVVGYKCRVSDLGRHHARPMEGGECVCARCDERVWATPAIPFMIPITVGFVCTVVYGDLISMIL